MAGKRAKVRLSADGVWECRLYLGTSMTGKPIRPYRRFPAAGSEQEAQEMADRWADGMTAGGVVKSAVLADLLKDYVEMRERNGAAPNSIRSWRRYERYVRRYMRGANARDLTVVDFNRFMQALLERKERGGAGLGRNTVLNVYNFLRAAYNHFVDSGICDANPLVYASKPSPDRHEASVLADWDFAALNERIERDLCPDADEADGYEKAVVAFAAWLSLNMGLRVGEVCALRRCDCRTGRRPHLHVCGTVIEPERCKPRRQDRTKGKRSRNVSVSDEEMRVISEFVRMQTAAIGSLGGTAPLVTRDGSWMRPTTVSGRFKQMCKECGVPKDVTFHTLRHTHASWLISEGYSIKALSERMGHAQPATTLNEYGHLVPGNDEAAPAVLADAKRRALGVPKDCQSDELA